MNLPATKEELINAGFEVIGLNLSLKGMDEISINWRTDKIDNLVFDIWDDDEDDFIFRLECPTKTELNKMLYPFIKRELDFAKKEKDYSFEECLNKKMNYFIFKGKVFHYDSNAKYIEYSPSYATREAANQALALSKLSFIIAEIDKDCPADKEDYNCVFYFDNHTSEICLASRSTRHSDSLLSCASIKGAEILKKQHPQLLKEALMVS